MLAYRRTGYPVALLAGIGDSSGALVGLNLLRGRLARRRGARRESGRQQGDVAVGIERGLDDRHGTRDHGKCVVTVTLKP